MTTHPAAPIAAHDEVASAASAPTTNPVRFTRAGLLTVLVCWLLVVFDGYDLIVYGTVQTTLIDTTGWGLTKATAGTVGSVAFAGMLVGAILAGRLSDSLGRKRAVLACAVVFSVFTIACAFAPNAPVFAILRFLAGVGLGGLVPSANALAAGVVPARWRAMVATLMMSGVPIGGSIAALTGILIIPAWGWQGMFLVAVLPLIFLIPLGVKYLPDLRSHHNPEEGTGFRAILGAPYLAVSVVFAVATMATLFAWYGLGTWLPGLMQQAGYNLGSALTFALTLNLGAVVGSILTAWAGDRFGSLPTGVAAAAVAGAALLTIVAAPPIGVVYAMLVLAGIGTHGTQCLIIAAVAGHYPDHLRGTALGWALGIGRIGAVAAPQVGGWMLAAGLGVNSNFIAFALAAGIASALIALAWRLTGNRSTSPTTVLAH
jgi:AAHS family benzoate transporter-like MFS transporter